MPKIPRGHANAIRIIISDELGLNPGYVHYAKLYREGKLEPSGYAKLEEAGHKAAELIVKNNKIAEAGALIDKYLNHEESTVL